MTLKEIDAAIEQINKKSLDIKTDLTDEDIKKLSDELKKLRDQVTNKNPFTSLYLALEKFNKDAGSANLQNLMEAGGRLAGNFGEISDAVRKVAEQTGNMKMAEVADLMSDISSNIKASEEGAEAWGGWWGAIIGGATDLLPKIIKWGSKTNETLQEEIEHFNTLVEVYDKLIDKQKEFIKSLSGQEAVDAYQKGADMADAQKLAAKNSLQSWFNSGASMFSHSEGYKYNKDFGNVLSQQKLMAASAEEWVTLMEENTELWARLPQEVKNYAQTVMDATETIKELADAAKEALTGLTMDEATSGIMKLVSQADLAFGDISESFYGHMKKAILRIVQEKSISGALEQWYTNFSESMKDGLTEGEVNALQARYKAIVEEGKAAYESAMKVAGIAIDETGGQNSLSGAIKGITQEQASLISGTANAMRVNQAQSIEILRNQLLHLASIDMKIGVSNHHLESIDGKLSNAYDPLRSQGL
jgi:hypothetical protein